MCCGQHGPEVEGWWPLSCSAWSPAPLSSSSSRPRPPFLRFVCPPPLRSTPLPLHLTISFGAVGQLTLVSLRLSLGFMALFVLTACFYRDYVPCMFTFKTALQVRARFVRTAVLLAMV